MAAKKKLAGWGARIYAARAAMREKTGAKMTQKDLGDLVGVSDAQIGYYESETNEPKWEMWVKLGKALREDPGLLAFGSSSRRGGRGPLTGGGGAEQAG